MVDSATDPPICDETPATEDERAQAALLADALGGGLPHPDADFLRALALAHAPRPVASLAHEAAVARACATVARAPSRQLVRVCFGAAAALALAAGVAFYLAPQQSDRGRPRLALARSTQALFDRPFESGRGSARVDRIALARQLDARDNRFAQWGIQ